MENIALKSLPWKNTIKAVTAKSKYLQHRKHKIRNKSIPLVSGLIYLKELERKAVHFRYRKSQLHHF